MRASRWLIVTLIVALIAAAAVYAYYAYRTSADGKAKTKQLTSAIPSTGYDVAVNYFKDNTLASITNNGKKVGQIKTPNFSYVNILKQTKDAAYLSVEPDGIGGYLLYAISFPLYKLDLSTNKLSKTTDYGSEVSSGERYIAGADRNQKIHSIVLKDMTTGKIKKFPVDKKYNQFGSIRISPNEMKLAYAAAIGDPDNERGDIYIIDIASGNQTKVNSDEITGHAPIVNYWKDNSTLIWN